MPELTLDENHIYRLDGQIIDGLTSTIAEAGLIRKSDPWYMGRGTAIHLATEYWDKGTLDEDNLDPQIKPYLESWKRFRQDQNYTPIHIEYPTYHPELLVGTKIDRLPGPIDLKSGVHEPWHLLQIAFQWATLKRNDMGDLAFKPMDIYLDPEGGAPKIKTYTPHELRTNFQTYCSMINFLRWRREKYGSSS